jgi:hypothetical protein
MIISIIHNGIAPSFSNEFFASRNENSYLLSIFIRFFKDFILNVTQE